MAAILTGLATALALNTATPSAESLGLRPSFPRPTASLPAPPRPPARRAPPSPGGQRLLELWIDGKSRDILARVEEREGAIYVANADLAAAGLGGLTDAGEGMTALSALGVTDARILPATQQLLLTTQAGPDRQVLQLRGASTFVTPRSDTGMVLRYDLAGLFGDQFGGWSAAAALAGSVFTPRARLDATGWMQAQEDETTRFVRLETAIEVNDAQDMRRWTLGDGVSSQLSWSRAVRFAGLQVARDFSLQPDLVTLPSIDYLGQASAPSSVDVFVNAARVYSGQVEPGPFEVRDIPVVTGRGEATVVLRDVLGRAVSTALPLYASADLLAAGLMDYSLEAGALRKAYGLESFSYGPPIAMASVRRGMTDTLTLQAHLEVSPDVAAAGAGASFTLGSVGTASASFAAGGGRDGHGFLYALSFESDLNRLRLFGAATATSGRYQDITAVHEGFDAPDLRLQFGATVDVGERGAFGASWLTDRSAQRRVDLATASYSYSTPRGWYFGASGVYDASGAGWAGQVYLRVPLSSTMSAAASTDVGGGPRASTLALSRRADPDGGLGYALTAVPEQERVQAEVVWFGDKAGGSAALASDDGKLAGRVLASGAVVAMDGSVFASRAIDGAVALVKTGQPGVQIYRENRPVAVADERGRALLVGLAPNARNRIGVRITDYPLTAELAAAELQVAPQRSSGVIVDFTPPVSHPLLLVIRLADGSFPPPGSLLKLDGGEALVIGRGGQAFVRDLAGPAQGSVRHGGRSCRIAVPAAPAGVGGDIPRLDVACSEDRL